MQGRHSCVFWKAGHTYSVLGPEQTEHVRANGTEVMATSFFGVPHSSRNENIVKKMLEEHNEKLEKESKGLEED